MTTAAAPVRSVHVIGSGRAGGSFARALRTAGWAVSVSGRRTDPALVADAVVAADLVLVATPDAAVADVAARLPQGPAVVAHCAGSLGLEVLAPHPRRASVHPLVSLPSPARGAERLAAGAWFAVAGDVIATEVVAALGGHAFAVADEQRVRYHAAACVAANHLVAVLGQVERLAADIDVPVAAYLDLARGALDNVADMGAAAALTGPAARGDQTTLSRHRLALDDRERPLYDCLARECQLLARANVGAPTDGSVTDGAG